MVLGNHAFRISYRYFGTLAYATITMNISYTVRAAIWLVPVMVLVLGFGSALISFVSFGII